MRLRLFCTIGVLLTYESFCCSMAIHPNKMLVATGQCAGHDRRDARVSVCVFWFAVSTL